jgi:hypothetical protein
MITTGPHLPHITPVVRTAQVNRLPSDYTMALADWASRRVTSAPAANTRPSDVSVFHDRGSCRCESATWTARHGSKAIRSKQGTDAKSPDSDITGIADCRLDQNLGAE